MPPANTVLEITGQVSEYQGVKQLTIQRMADCISHTPADFMPDSGQDLAKVFDEACAICDDIDDAELQLITQRCLMELKAAWLERPGAKTVHHAYVGGTLVHSVDTANVALAISSEIPEANKSLVAAGALLHDLGKLFSYKFDGAVIEMTNVGQLLGHVYAGANFIDNFAEEVFDKFDKPTEYKILLLKHVILAHHGVLEHGSPVTPRCIEARIVHSADGLSAAAETLRAATRLVPYGSQWTEKVWSMDNLPQLTTTFVDNLFSWELPL